MIHLGPVGSPPTPIIVGTQTRTSPADSKHLGPVGSPPTPYILNAPFRLLAASFHLFVHFAERANSPAPFLVFCRVLGYADGDFRKFNK